MGYFYSFYKNLDMNNFTPSNSLVNVGQCGKFGSSYAIFLQGGGSVTLNLTGVSGTFNVKKLDINSGAVANLSDITGGAPRVITSGTANDVSILVTLAGAVLNTPSDSERGARPGSAGNRGGQSGWDGLR